MALKASRGGREYDKFVADSGGDTALRTTSTSSVTEITLSAAADITPATGGTSYSTNTNWFGNLVWSIMITLLSFHSTVLKDESITLLSINDFKKRLFKN